MQKSHSARYRHLPVMPVEVMKNLSPRNGDVAVDGTTGLGGHSRLIGQALGSTGRLICLDRDSHAMEMARAGLADLSCHVDFVNQVFEFMDRELEHLELPGAECILLDLGVSSLQLDSPERGFSFLRDGPLDMRMGWNASETARDIVNNWSEDRLARLFAELGEERFSRRLARCIVERRTIRPIETTIELSELATRSVPRKGRTHPATRMFQAIRMRVNDELGCLSRGLAAAGRALAPGGRLAVLSYHSLEDRLTKRTFTRWRDMGLVKWAMDGAAVPSREEIEVNPRARSAKLRVVERLS
ncbi:MAG: 16S rRNA (cytosine(1402)-N(4))-methyltransferase RsmH [Planctomycetota bacterium]|jgi:16S rRNA (cytosine1402-N4)-methyltransferase|nr:16S rRNA (cytosine(1402)-N(4))-methyltransferase RsmH [Planctomycetota bacterium]